MVIVTGPKRSGTSMWMQVLRAGGLPVMGEAFLRHWGEFIRACNPGGFYESRLRGGLNGYHLAPSANSCRTLTRMVTC